MKPQAHHLKPGKLSLAVATILLLVSAVSQVCGQSNNQLTSKLIKLKTGITLNYVVQGKPDGPCVVLLHGAGDSWHSYDRVFPLIPSSYRVYAITLRGHGLSDHPETGFSRNDFAADILDFLDQFHIQHATLVGHSLGSFVAQTVVEQDSAHHIDRLVLIGSGPGRQAERSTTDEARNAFSALQDPIPYTFARDFQASTIYGTVPASFFETLVSEAQKVPASTWHGLGTFLGSDSFDDLKKIRVPTLALWGDKDNFFKRTDEDLLVKTVPNAVLKVYPDTGHALHWEQPEKFTQDLLSFIASTGSKTE